MGFQPSDFIVAGALCLFFIGGLTVLFVGGVMLYAMFDKSKAVKPKSLPSNTIDAGIRDLLEEGREDEAVEVYQKFAGVDEYTARDMVEKIKREMDSR
jgi:hypothetical protein